VIEQVLAGFQLEWPNLRVKHQKDVFFSKGSRDCLTFPEKLELEPIKDELYPGRRGLRLSFELPKGAYATIMVKRITDAAERSQ
jgi:tRNA pseudouridine13 synthase